MSAEIDELLEDEYATQQEGILHIQNAEVNRENEKKPGIEVSALLILFSLSFLPQLPTINDILPQNIRSRCNSRQWIQISMGHPDS